MSGKKIGTALHPLVQLLPAAVLAAVLLVTLPGTVPVLAEVPQRLEMAAVEETPAPVEEIAEEELVDEILEEHVDMTPDK